MYCSSCGNTNLETSLQCVQCGKALFPSKETPSLEYQRAAEHVDSRTYIRAGAIFGYLAMYAILKVLQADLYMSETHVVVGSIGGAVAGVLMARHLVKWKRENR